MDTQYGQDALANRALYDAMADLHIHSFGEGMGS